MKKPQAIKFWEALNDSDNVGEILSKFENKKGYPSRRTLWRWSQLNNGFRRRLSLQEIVKNTGWTKEAVEKKWIWWQSEFGSGYRRETQPTSAGEGPSQVAPNEPNRSCSCPPDGIYVGQLRKSGVPKGMVGELLRIWRSCHLAGQHAGCSQYAQLVKDIANGIPLKQAQSLLNLGDLEHEFGVGRDPLTSDVGRSYFSWEGNDQRNAALAEYTERTEPDPATAEAQKNHLNDTTKLLKDFAGQVEAALDKADYNITFDLEESPFFLRGIQSHCCEVKDDLWKFVRLREDYQGKERDLVDHISRNAPTGANGYFTQNIVESLLKTGLRPYSPRYRRERSGNALWQLDTMVKDQWRAIAEGSNDLINRCQEIHAESVKTYRGSSEVRDLAARRKKIFGSLKVMRETTKQALADQDYLRKICPLCPIVLSQLVL